MSGQTAATTRIAIAGCSVGLLAALHGCRFQNDDAARPSAALPQALVVPAAVPEAALAAAQRSLDSCKALASSRTAAAVDRGISSATMPTRVAVHSARTFSLIIPEGVSAVPRDSVLDVAELYWPGCDQCWFRVAVTSDSGVNLEARIARMVAAQRRIDSINKDPQTEVHEFDEIGGPPLPFTTSTGRGYMVDISCGDCGGYDLFFERAGQIGTASIGSSGPWPQCEMIVAAKTFTWR